MMLFFCRFLLVLSLIVYTQVGFAKDILSIVRKPLLTAVLDSSKKINQIEIKQIDFRPNQATGIHLHPCPVVGYISKGTVLFQIEGEKAKTLTAGDVFFEPANKKILYFDNASTKESMTFIAFYLLSKDDKEIIRML